MEFALKTCKLKLSTNAIETEPVGNPQKDASDQRNTVKPDAKRYQKEQKIVEQKTNFNAQPGISEKGSEKKTFIDPHKNSFGSAGKKKLLKLNFQRSSTSQTAITNARADDADITNRVVKQEDTEESTEVNLYPANGEVEQHRDGSTGKDSSHAAVEV